MEALSEVSWKLPLPSDRVRAIGSPLAWSYATTTMLPRATDPLWTVPEMVDWGASVVSTPVVAAPGLTATSGAVAADVAPPEKRVL